MTVSRRKLEIIRWACIGVSLALIIANWDWKYTGGAAVVWFGLFILFGLTGAMLTLHLHPPKFFEKLERRDG